MDNKDNRTLQALYESCRDARGNDPCVEIGKQVWNLSKSAFMIALSQGASVPDNFTPSAEEIQTAGEAVKGYAYENFGYGPEMLVRDHSNLKQVVEDLFRKGHHLQSGEKAAFERSGKFRG